MSAEPITVTDATFEEEVDGSSLPVLVDFWAEWCGPCHMIAPILTEIAADFDGKLKVAKLNSDSNPDTTIACRVQSLPSLLVYNDGEEVARIVGARPKHAILEEIRRVVRID